MPDPSADEGGREREPTIFDHLFDSGTLTCRYCGTHYFQAMKGWPCDLALVAAAQVGEKQRVNAAYRAIDEAMKDSFIKCSERNKRNLP